MAAIKSLREIGGGVWSWTVTSKDPDDRGKYRTGPEGKRLYKFYDGKGYQQIQGPDFDLGKIQPKGIKAKLEREFS